MVVCLFVVHTKPPELICKHFRNNHTGLRTGKVFDEVLQGSDNRRKRERGREGERVSDLVSLIDIVN